MRSKPITSVTCDPDVISIRANESGYGRGEKSPASGQDGCLRGGIRGLRSDCKTGDTLDSILRIRWWPIMGDMTQSVLLKYYYRWPNFGQVAVAVSVLWPKFSRGGPGFWIVAPLCYLAEVVVTSHSITRSSHDMMVAPSQPCHAASSQAELWWCDDTHWCHTPPSHHHTISAWMRCCAKCISHS